MRFGFGAWNDLLRLVEFLLNFFHLSFSGIRSKHAKESELLDLRGGEIGTLARIRIAA